MFSVLLFSWFLRTLSIFSIVFGRTSFLLACWYKFSELMLLQMFSLEIFFLSASKLATFTNQLFPLSKFIANQSFFFRSSLAQFENTFDSRSNISSWHVSTIMAEMGLLLSRQSEQLWVELAPDTDPKILVLFSMFFL